jgi:hypothetical protein
MEGMVVAVVAAEACVELAVELDKTDAFVDSISKSGVPPLTLHPLLLSLLLSFLCIFG